MLTIILAIISTILVLIGLASTILPFMPGATIAWLGLFIFAIGTGFKRISIITTIVFFVVTLLTFVFDFFAPIMMSRKYKTSKLGTLGGRLGSFLSNVTLGYPWTIIGHFGGTILGELLDKRQLGQALKIAFGTIIGMIASMLLNIIVVLIILGFLIGSWFR
jgi:hypothetical protein